MSEPFLGEIRFFGFNFAPMGWAFCQGQLMPITQNEALFSLIGTLYGGDGQRTFGIPDLRGRVPMGFGQGPGLSSHVIGEIAGTESVALSTQNLPQHNHMVNVSPVTANTNVPTGNYLAETEAGTSRAPVPALGYSNTAPTAQLAPNTVSYIGGNQPVYNLQPYLVGNFCIALQGIFPNRGD